MNPFRINRPLSRRSAVLAAAGAAASLRYTSTFAQTPTAWTGATPVATPSGSFAPITGVERDEFVVGMYGLPASLEPGIDSGNTAQATLLNCYETLVRRDARNGGTIAPHLATAWTRESDTVTVFRLREGVTFHDGSPLTAADVVFTFERILNSDAESQFASVKNTYIQTIESVEAIDDLTVRFTTIAPDPVLLGRLTQVPCFIVNKAWVEKVGEEGLTQQAMGTGPYAITAFTPGVEIVMERYEGYWDTASPAGKVTFTVIAETAARITALINGEIQIATSMSPDQVASIESQGTVTTRSTGLANAHIVTFDTKKPGLGDKRVRQALSLAIDRTLIIDAIFQGRATHLRQFQFPDYGQLLDESRPLTEYDMDRARKLLEESDYNGEKIAYQLVPGYYLNAEQTGQVVVESWQALGINAELQLGDTFKLFTEEGSAQTWSCTNMWGDPASGYWRQFGKGSTSQGAIWDAPEEFNTVGVEAVETLDVARRRELYSTLQDIWNDEQMSTDLYAIDNIAGVDAETNWEPNPLHAVDLHWYNFSFNK